MTPRHVDKPALVESGPSEVLVFADTLERAIDQTRRHWHLEHTDFRIETVREPKSGWFGFGRREGLFRAVRTSSQDEDMSLKAELAQLLASSTSLRDVVGTNLESTADAVAPSNAGPGAESAVRGDATQALSLLPGQARVRDGRLEVCGSALVIVHDGIDLYVNGRQRQGTTMIRETDEVRVELSVATEQEGFRITVTPDEMAALLEIHGTRRFRLQDAPPARPLLLAVEEVSLPPQGLSEEAIRAELTKTGITYGIDWEAISRALQELPVEPVVIARGSPAHPGQPAYAEFLFEKRSERRVVLRDDESVDYRGILEVPFVEAGDLLVRRIPGEAGQPGRTVRGSELPPPQAEVLLLAGPGAQLDEDGSAIYAAAPGRPQVEESTPGRYLVRVVPVLRHGTVDLSSGNLKFAGDIIIHGNVEESMSVVAGGDVIVYGTVSKAYVEAGGRLSVRGNSFNSTLVAGGRAAFFAAEQPLLERVTATLDKLQQAIAQVQTHPNFAELALDETRFSMLVRLLVREHMRELPNLLRMLSTRLSSHDQRDVLSEGLRALVGRHAMVSGGVTFRNQTEIEALRTMLLEAIALARAAPRDRADATLRYVHNCRVEALGNIRVSGEGSYYSNFHAGKRFRSAGPVRGGRVVAHDGADVSEAGSDMGVTTELVTETGTIRVGRVFPGVILRAARHVRRVTNVRESVVHQSSQEETPQHIAV